MSLDWYLHGPRSILAQQLRRDIRARRRQFDTGVKFVYKNLDQVWEADGHVVLNHTTDPNWQHWAYHHTGGWIPVVVHREFEEAKASAEFHRWPEEIALPPDPGNYVLAGWPREDEDEVDYKMRVPCHSKNTAIAVADSLRSLGMKTKHEEVTSDR